LPTRITPRRVENVPKNARAQFGAAGEDLLLFIEFDTDGTLAMAGVTN
jgi:hypothetical protein